MGLQFMSTNVASFVAITKDNNSIVTSFVSKETWVQLEVHYSRKLGA